MVNVWYWCPQLRSATTSETEVESKERWDKIPKLARKNTAGGARQVLWCKAGWIAPCVCDAAPSLPVWRENVRQGQVLDGDDFADVDVNVIGVFWGLPILTFNINLRGAAQLIFVASPQGTRPARLIGEVSPCFTRTMISHDLEKIPRFPDIFCPHWASWFSRLYMWVSDGEPLFYVDSCLYQ